MWKPFISPFVLFCALATAFPVGAYTEAEHQENMKNAVYSESFSRIDAIIEDARDNLPSPFYEQMRKNREEWFAGFEDYSPDAIDEAADDNIDAAANAYIELEGLDAAEAYARAAADKAESLQTDYRRFWLVSNPDGIQGLYQLTTGEGTTGNMLEVMHTSDGIYDVRLEVEADSGESISTVEFHGGGTFADGVVNLVDTNGNVEGAVPLQVRLDPDAVFGTPAQVLIDDAFRAQPDYESRYSWMEIAGTYAPVHSSAR